MSNLQNFNKGFFKENAVFVQLLGMCPTLGVTTTAVNGLGMGLATTFVLLMSNMVVSMVKSFIPDKVRIPAYIVIIASFVTIVDLVMAGYVPELHENLGLFIPLIVVNCRGPGTGRSICIQKRCGFFHFRWSWNGLGFTMALVMLGSVRELFGSLSLLDLNLLMQTAYCYSSCLRVHLSLLDF
jgi:electron transport complex protein RnfE